MSKLPQQPKNLNEAYSDQFRISFMNLREMSYTCQVGNLPGVSQSTIEVANQNNYISVNSTKLRYEPLAVTFKVDEDLNNYQEIYAWLIGITSPQNFAQFEDFQERQKKFSKSGYQVTVDATLIQLTQVYNPNIEIVFVDIQPEALTALDFTIAAAGEPLLATALFKYDYFYFRKKTQL